MNYNKNYDNNKRYFFIPLHLFDSVHFQNSQILKSLLFSKRPHFF